MPDRLAVEWFVRGACQEHAETNPKPDLYGFTFKTYGVVWRYLQGQQDLHRATEFEYQVARAAALVFGQPKDKTGL